jgi:hypothetical protein
MSDDSRIHLDDATVHLATDVDGVDSPYTGGICILPSGFVELHDADTYLPPHAVAYVTEE